MKLKKRALHVLLSLATLSFAEVAFSQNLAPFVFAGPDKALAVPETSVTLSGIVSDPDSDIGTYAWSKVSGAACTITSPTAAATTVTGLATGTYVFRLTGTDGASESASDEVQVVVHASAGKTVTLTATSAGHIYRPNMASFNILPGDTIAIAPGSYPNGIIIGGFAGSATNPVKIINGGGLVQTRSLGIAHAKHFKVSGTGSTDAYGFKIGGHYLSTGLSIGRETSDYEVERVEVENSSVGLFCKIQPVLGEPLTQHLGWTIANVFLHDNYIHDTDKEGLYIGHTFPNGDENSDDLVPVRMQNVKIYNNIVTSTGWDAMQLSNAREGGEIFNNVVTNYGTLREPAQQAGIQLGGNTTGRVYANTIHTGTGPALTAYGYGDVYLSKNIITKTATGGSPPNQHAIYISGGVNLIEGNPGLRVHVLSNKIVEPVNLAILSQDNNHNQVAGEIRLNTILDPLGRTVSQLIWSAAGDVISGNTVFTGNPTVTVQTPSELAFTTNASTLAIAGVAADDGGVTSVTWANALTGAIGTAGGTTSNWSIPSIPVAPGLNQITITARDGDNNTGTAVLAIRHLPPIGTLKAAYNAGSLSSSFSSVDSPGMVYEKDPNITAIVTGGSATTITPAVGIANTQDDGLFNTYRWGNHTWNITGLDPGVYEIRLRFAANATDTVGARVFNIAMEGITVRSNFDIRANPPTPVNTARDEIINTTVTDGTLNIQFTGVQGQAKINSIEVRTSSPSGFTGVAIGTGSSGSSMVGSGGELSVTGNGGILGGTADSGWFEKVSETGNFQVIVKNEVLTGGSAARAGIMLREGSAAGARMVFLGTSTATNYITASRTVVNQAATVTLASETYTYPAAWLMLARQGDVVSWAVSTDGVSFTALNSVTLTGLSSSVDVGLYVTSGGGSVATALFGDFETSPLALAAYNCGKIAGGDTTSLDDGITKYLQDPNQGPVVSGGTATTVTPSVAIADTEDDAIFQSYRWGNQTWNIPVPAAGTYTVNLRFVANSGETTTNRIFDVAVEGGTVLSGFNIRQAAGGLNKALTIPIDVVVTDGTLNVQFTSIEGQAKINAISVVPKP